MFSTLKNWFIPHEGNNHRPHFLHGQTARYVVVALLVLELGAFVLPTLSFVNFAGSSSVSNMASILPAVLGDLTNKEREQNNLKDLVVNDLLNKAAQMKADDMAAKGYFAHTSPEGLTPWHWLDAVGYNYNYAGENLAINFSDSEDVTDAWMHSPTHRANIVKASYTQVGTGVATGEYEGKKTTFVAQVYANPVAVPPSAVKDADSSEEAAPAKVTTVPGPDVLGAETEAKAPSLVQAGRDESVTQNDAVVVTSAIPVQKEPTFLEKLFASPHNSFNIVLYMFLGFMIIVLLLNICIKMNVQHPDLITNGLAVIAVIGILFVGNNYISKKNIAISDSINYSADHTVVFQ